MNDRLFLEHKGRKKALNLGKLLGEGAVGKVYAVEGSPTLAVKIYHEISEALAIEPKISMMLTNCPDLPALERNGVSYPQIAWPVARVVDENGRFRGFSMPAIDLKHSTSLVNLLQKSSRRAEKLSDYYGYRVMVAHNLASMFAELHRAGHHMIDMKPANLRIYPQTSWIAVVDTDGFSIAGTDKRIAAGQVSDDYIAPESWRRSSQDLGEEQDLFALAVIVFQLLNNGAHPFSGRAVDADHPLPTDIQTRILEGLYAYGAEPHAKVRPAAMSIHKTFRRETRQMFDQAFLPGHRRPSAEAWRQHLSKLLQMLTPCQANPAEHAHFGSGCGFCLYEAQFAAVVANAKPRPKPAPKRIMPAEISRRATVSGHAAGSYSYPASRSPYGNSRRSKKNGGSRGSHRVRSRILTAIGAGLALGGLMTLGLFVEQITEGLVTPRAVASSSDTKDLGTGIARLQTFPMPLYYRVVPDRHGSGDALRIGPGVDFNTAETVSANERVTGLAESVDKQGKRWIWVKLDGGGSGYLSAARLAQVNDLFDADRYPPATRVTAPLGSARPVSSVDTLPDADTATDVPSQPTDTSPARIARPDAIPMAIPSDSDQSADQ